MSITITRRIDLEGKGGLSATLEEEIECATITEALDAISQDALGGFAPCVISSVRRVEYIFEEIP